VAFIGLQPDKPPLAGLQAIHAIEHRLQLRPFQTTYLCATQAQMLCKPEQPPGIAVNANPQLAIRYWTLAPGMHPMGELPPSLLARRLPGGMFGQALGQTGEILRQAGAVEAVANQKLRIVVAKVPADEIKTRLQLPQFGTQALSEKVLQHHAHRQIVDHLDPVGLEPFVTRVQLPPKEHAGPAGQLQGQPLDITGPFVLTQPETAQFGDDGLHRVIGQGFQM